MSYSSNCNCTEHIDTEYHPNDSNQNVNWPFVLSVFFGSVESHKESDNRSNDHQLPSPEVDPRQSVAPHSCFKKSLK